jgi:gliding motility-associated protein GldC
MKSQINIEIALDEDKMPETIHWKAPDGGVEDWQEAKAFFVGLWDGKEKSALRIDLWTKKMMVDEMNEFLYQSLYGMAETYLRATKNESLAKELQAFAVSFRKKADELLEKENQ